MLILTLFEQSPHIKVHPDFIYTRHTTSKELFPQNGFTQLLFGKTCKHEKLLSLWESHGMGGAKWFKVRMYYVKIPINRKYACNLFAFLPAQTCSAFFLYRHYTKDMQWICWHFLRDILGNLLIERKHYHRKSTSYFCLKKRIMCLWYMYAEQAWCWVNSRADRAGCSMSRSIVVFKVIQGSHPCTATNDWTEDIAVKCLTNFDPTLVMY